MSKKFGRALFGYKPKQVINEMQQMDIEAQNEIIRLEMELDRLKAELKTTEDTGKELQGQLDQFIAKERLIAEVMVNAEINARRIEEQASAKAQTMIESAEKELKARLNEIDLLRTRITQFKDEFRTTLDNYRLSLDHVREEPQESAFVPSVISNEKVFEIKQRDIS